MMRSMYAGVAGLRTHQTRMDVIGNNIANVNTVGFKNSNVTFVDVFYQTTQSASGPNSDTGTAGINAKQIGLGSSVSTIYKNITETGGTQTTNNPFDIMINGDSFFVVNSGGENMFTKNGAFTVDANGTLCTGYGANVMGWQVSKDDPTKTVADAVSPLRIMSAENKYAPPEATTNAYVTGNIDMKDTQLKEDGGKMMQISFYDSLGYSYTAKFGVKQATGDDGATNIYGVYLNDIVDAKNKSLFVTETVGDDGKIEYSAKEMALSFKQILTGTDAGDGAESTLGEVTVDPDTGKVSIAADTALFSVVFDGNTGDFKTVSFDGTAEAEGVTKSVAMSFGDISPNPFAAALEIDWSKLTMYSTSESSALEGHMGDTDGNGKGKKVGNMSGVSIDTAGKIFGSYDNGDLRLLGQIAVASFANPSGLEAMGNSLFKQTQNSGEFDGVGQDPSKNGSLSTGVLEMSNVDLSSQFTDMITTQRGFQANSRIITVSDTLLEELINLKR